MATYGNDESLPFMICDGCGEPFCLLCIQVGERAKVFVDPEFSLFQGLPYCVDCMAALVVRTTPVVSGDKRKGA